MMAAMDRTRLPVSGLRVIPADIPGPTAMTSTRAREPQTLHSRQQSGAGASGRRVAPARDRATRPARSAPGQPRGGASHYVPLRGGSRMAGCRPGAS